MRLLLLSILLLAVCNVSQAQFSDVPQFNDDIDDAGLYLVSPQTAKLSLYPNPTNGNFTIALGSHKDGKTQILVLNNEGKVMNYRLIEDAAANPTVNFSLTHLAKGMYFVKIAHGHTSETIKFYVRG